MVACLCSSQRTHEAVQSPGCEAIVRCRLGAGDDNIKGVPGARPAAPGRAAAPHRHEQPQLLPQLRGRPPLQTHSFSPLSDAVEAALQWPTANTWGSLILAAIRDQWENVSVGEAWTGKLGGDGGRQGYQPRRGSSAQLWRPGQHLPDVGLWCRHALLNCRTAPFLAGSEMIGVVNSYSVLARVSGMRAVFASAGSQTIPVQCRANNRLMDILPT